MSLKAFACHSSHDSLYVLETVAFLKRHFPVFTYEDYQRADKSFLDTINFHLREAGLAIVFLGATYADSPYLNSEVNALSILKAEGQELQVVFVLLVDNTKNIPADLVGYPRIKAFLDPDLENSSDTTRHPGKIPPSETARLIVASLHMLWKAVDDLPHNPHLFSYEKDIVKFVARIHRLGDSLFTDEAQEEDRSKIEEGAPIDWPRVIRLWENPGLIARGISRYSNLPISAMQAEFGNFRPDDARVRAMALEGDREEGPDMSLPEAGPRSELLFPIHGPHRNLQVAVLVSGGIAPGINAVIDGIVQRHWKYHRSKGHRITVRGYQNGFHGVLGGRFYLLGPDEKSMSQVPRGNQLATSEFADQGGSMLGTYRADSLIASDDRLMNLLTLAERLDGIDILYMIGGDGTMRAAHALWNVALERSRARGTVPLSVVAIPKSMDNDILWVWQSFGFLSAAEKAREVIRQLHSEVDSNPRLCVLQLFGSDSGFVVSHAVLASAAGHCDLALIPEVPFSLLGVAQSLTNSISNRESTIPGGLVVMAETAIPVDAAWYIDPSSHPLPTELTSEQRHIAEAIRSGLADRISNNEKAAILEFDALRRRGERIQGQTSDFLRSAGLRVVMLGLEAALKSQEVFHHVQFNQLRVLANEPRHLLRTIPPSTSDIVMGQRLGALAVDNAMAGYSDFMISQWLTEFVLVPLKLVVLGRKRIPESGNFWKSVLAKTGQSSDLVAPWPHSS